jgi:integral membrane protein
MLHTHIGRLRTIGMMEGMSFLLLLLIAMPLKYLAGLPEGVQIMGWAHGLLFVLYMVALAIVFFAHRWSFWRGLTGFLVAFVPGGPFWFDRSLKEEETQRLKQASERAAP